MGMVPKTTKSEIKLYKNIGVVKFFGFLGTIVGSVYLGGFLFKSVLLKILFVVFCTLVFIICSFKSPTDPSKSFFKGLIDYLKFFIHKKDVYSENSEEYKLHEGECYQREVKKENRKEKFKRFKKKKE